MSKHTPGPWLLKETSSGGAILHRPNGQQDHLQIVPEADAKLIAAAPDLFALVDRVARLNENACEIGAGMLMQLVTEARAAIRKATE